MNSGEPLSILVFEDSPTDALLLEASLQNVIEFDFVLELSDSLKDGLQKLDGKHYDAILLDLGLPDSSGLDTFERVRASATNIPVVILSGNDDRDVLADAMHRGADNYLNKNSADGNRIAIAILSAIRNRMRPQ